MRAESQAFWGSESIVFSASELQRSPVFSPRRQGTRAEPAAVCRALLLARSQKIKLALEGGAVTRTRESTRPATAVVLSLGVSQLALRSRADVVRNRCRRGLARELGVRWRRR